MMFNAGDKIKVKSSYCDGEMLIESDRAVVDFVSKDPNGDRVWAYWNENTVSTWLPVNYVELVK